MSSMCTQHPPSINSILLQVNIERPSNQVVKRHFSRNSYIKAQSVERCLFAISANSSKYRCFARGSFSHNIYGLQLTCLTQQTCNVTQESYTISYMVKKINDEDKLEHLGKYVVNTCKHLKNRHFLANGVHPGNIFFIFFLNPCGSNTSHW